MGHRRAVGFIFAVLLVGCSSFGSVSPLLTEENAELDPQLVGTWLDSAGTMAILVREKYKSYSLTVTNGEGDRSEYTARLGYVGSLRVLELLGEGPSPGPGEGGNGPALPLYYPLLIDSIGTHVRVRLLNADSLSRFLDRKPKALGHDTQDDDHGTKATIVTAPTGKWQRFMMEFARQRGVTDAITFIRYPTPRLHVTAGIRGRQYRYSGPGECLHASNGRFLGEKADTWRLSLESGSRDSVSPEPMRLAAWRMGAGPVAFAASARVMQDRGSSWIDLLGKGALQVTERDSGTALSLEGEELTGGPIRIAVGCSAVTELNNW